MTQWTAADFPQDVLDLYDAYAHGRITRDEFLDRVAEHAVGGMSAHAILAALSPNYARAEQVSFNDPDITPEWITYPSPNGHGDVRAYMVHPNGSKAAPGVVVAHENRGLNPYIQDVARRVAKAGFIALAPDGLTPVGGYPGNDEEGRALQQQLDGQKLMNDFFAAVEFLASHDSVRGKVGIVGFCYGGGVANAAAVAYPDLGAAVPFYGRQPDPADVPRIQAPILLHYAEFDARINEGWPEFEAALNKHGKRYEAFIYPDVNHGFHNDSTPRYDPHAAELSWQRSIDWFRRYLVI